MIKLPAQHLCDMHGDSASTATRPPSVTEGQVRGHVTTAMGTKNALDSLVARTCYVTDAPDPFRPASAAGNKEAGSCQHISKLTHLLYLCQAGVPTQALQICRHLPQIDNPLRFEVWGPGS